MDSGSSEPVRALRGPGRLVLIVGPSGSGKDTLIRRVQSAAAGNPHLVFAQRIVTRAPGRDEDNLALSEAAFHREAERGAFALAWDAHGLRYGVPASIDADIAAGRTVVVNASRTIIAAARRRFAVVGVALIDAPREVLARRLAGRGREEQGDIELRLARRPEGFGRDDADLVIVNDGSPDAGAEALLRFCLGAA